MITEKEIQAFWNRFDLIMISWGAVSGFFILSVVAFFVSIALYFFGVDWWIWLYIYGLTVPINIFLKYGLGVKGLWLFNDTKDGDFGDPNEIEKAGHTGKSKLFIIIWWWFRNHSWNYIIRYNPEWDKGNAYDFLILKTTLTPEQIKKNRWTWCTKSGVHGYHYIAFRIYEGGKVYCRYSKANYNKEKLMGAGGDRYKLKIR